MFGWFKREKIKTLSLPEKFANGFIQPLTVQRLEIKLGEKLVVTDGWCAVIVAKDKPQDIFMPGEYELNIPSLPHTTKALKLDKSKIKKHKGEQQIVFPTKFKCDLYFVNTRVFANQDWRASRIFMRDKKCGKYNLSLQGKFDFQSINVTNTIKLFLLEWAVINSSKAQLRLQQYVGEFVSNAMEWSKTTDPEYINNKENLSEMLSPIISKNFEKYGISINNFKVEKVDFSRDVTALLSQKEREQKQNIEQDENAIKNEDINPEKENETKQLTQNNVIDKGVLKNDVDLEKIEKEENFIEPEKEKNYFADDFLSKKLKENEKKTEDKNIEIIDYTVLKDDELINFKNTTTKNQKDADDSIKICPKCGKTHEKTDQICDCGCILD